MGEIADALRRARSGWSPFQAEREPREPRERDRGPGAFTAEGVERTARSEAPPAATPAARLGQLAPGDEAILHTDGVAFEACRQTALRVRNALDERAARSVAVVSSIQSEGKTTTSCNLALALASLTPERDVALVDLDLRRPSVARACGIAPEHGIEQVLRGELTLEAVRTEVDRPPLDVYPAILPQRAAHELLARREFREMLAELERRYAYVVIDTPPTLLVPDARMILERVACCIPIARAGVSRVRAYRAMLALLPENQVLGSLLNGGRSEGYDYRGYEYGDAPQVADAALAGRSQGGARG